MSAEEIKEKDDKTVEVELPELTRPLEKMTVKELREIGLLVPTMVGVHSMKKAELVEQLTSVYGLETDTKREIEGDRRPEGQDQGVQGAESRGPGVRRQEPDQHVPPQDKPS